ncbi:2-amino-4-hydroxy-6-hydroxymethyldihydropteridine diphosphokinase [Sphingobacterium bovisgrunnientis]|jgi:2-amino-4-hydroxy-6-hydroxymethyldihydropteridine diphosphokinase|uniref:2-amino-4-hydroxy-6- hydroxymethyldihydropteridine diphosphokinase n=1 Tax=Sphingobacterium bovisgrunnientis TaxID=1874697 RepID=UPI00135B97F4|nr:2-amino-4-hydroxy-6-hydroxymethyldihydropteridine diphosphokinase [Sphingobacterium bovisgrunnientis]
MSIVNEIYILLGANLGDPITQLGKARELLKQKLGNLVKASSVYQSEAWGVEDQPIFLNQVLLIETDKSADESLLICQNIENELGRIRKEKWGARLIDIDILYFNSEIIDKPLLKIPHPYIQDRKFTLQPLCEIANSYKHPKLNLTNEQLLLICKDNLEVVKI